jgi:DNA repair protein RecO (recombination protein O)
MHVEREPGCVLHARPWRETGMLLEVLTPGHGRVGLIQRGARRGRRAPEARPFRLLELGWRGRGELPTVTRVEALEPFPGLEGVAAVCGLYVNELTVRLLPRGLPSAELFRAYCATLLALGGQARLDAALRGYELALLEALGFAPVLDRDAAGKAVCAGRRYRYDRARGLVPEEEGPGVGPSITGAGALALARGRLETPAERREARVLLRHLLEPLLGDRPLHSRALLRRLQSPRRNDSPRSPIP